MLPLAKALASLDVDDLPSFDALQPKALQINCLQVCDTYRGQGVGSSMLERTTAWASSHGWEEVYSSAVDHILPIMAWDGHLSNVVLTKHGFTTVAKVEDGGVAEAALHMRQGGHGKKVQGIWQSQYSHITEGHTFYRYTMKLDLRDRACPHT